MNKESRYRNHRLKMQLKSGVRLAAKGALFIGGIVAIILLTLFVGRITGAEGRTSELWIGVGMFAAIYAWYRYFTRRHYVSS